MHDTARDIARRFFAMYVHDRSVIVEIGARDVNGALREVCPGCAAYIGLDVEPGPGVDVVTSAEEPLPVAAESADVVVASSVFEHDTFFWQTFLEMARIAKPGAVIYINAPSNGTYHRFPTDNWRFYPDCGQALELWARRNGCDLHLVESFIAERAGDIWNDFVAVFMKGPTPSPDRFQYLSADVPCTNVWRTGEKNVQLPRELSEDMLLIERSREEVDRLRVGSGQPEPFRDQAAFFDLETKLVGEHLADLTRRTESIHRSLDLLDSALKPEGEQLRGALARCISEAASLLESLEEMQARARTFANLASTTASKNKQHP
ncbi:methyltransferase domain-containing protein [Mesorhizobium sp. VK9D]|uniref:methyltransferase domain-containing protein n=1 Tax=Mesorhizobium australafricanum TaxID=3072311 RepID=UPI002A241748|nr:methyltransferase domain-containing protein [Mesorhizobium sp. VK9D]MDX8456010.1 methyltransferase domain-containing protein [Mesorhizobium sp. VK9D]